MELETKKSVKERIVIISNEIRVAKAGKNDFMKVEYFKPDDIMKAVNPLLKTYELLSHMDMTFSKEKEMYEGILTISDFKTEDSVVYKLDIPLQDLKNVGKAQSAGATFTYLKRYFFMNMLNLADNKADLDDPKNKVAEKIDWEAKMKKVKNEKELKELWFKVPAIEQKNLQSLKDLLKQEFTPTKDVDQS